MGFWGELGEEVGLRDHSVTVPVEPLEQFINVTLAERAFTVCVGCELPDCDLL